MKTIITIGRQFGSGGKEVGIRVAKELGIPFYDKELPCPAAGLGTPWNSRCIWPPSTPSARWRRRAPA